LLIGKRFQFSSDFDVASDEFLSIFHDFH
jgi:hypothetical protein